MNILIVGYGNIGKHIYEEFQALQPDIYDAYLPGYNERLNKKYNFAFICVPTDMLPDGCCDTSVVTQAVSETQADIIVIKSTVPPGTTERLIAETGKRIVFSPEHYGVTHHCKADPGFVILGGEKEQTAKVAVLYGKVKNGYYKIRFTDYKTAELSKYMLNSFLALKVTFCNEFADLAAKFGVSYPELRELFILDERISPSHTVVYPDKPFYDSHCFNKDVPALVRFAGVSAPLMSRVQDINFSKKNNKPLWDMQTRNAMLQIVQSTPRKYECSVCLIIRDENEYLEEWLNWHIGQGVQHFYIYDHGSKYPVAAFIKGLDADISDKVTVVDWSGSHNNAQPDAYNDCLKRFGSESRWIGFIDADEHVRVKTGQTIPEFLRDYKEFAGIMATWITYGANGQKNKSDAPLRERFWRTASQKTWADKMGKVFVQPLLMEDMYIHNGHAIPGFHIVGEHEDVVPNAQLWRRNPTTDLICVDHFYTKSYEEWIEKLKRGRCHARNVRKYNDFFRYNPDMEHCRETDVPVQEYEVSSKNLYECSLCLIIRDENEYLEEWLNWHIGQGVQHFYIYDNGSKQSVTDYLKTLGTEIFNKVTVVDWSSGHQNAQPDAYNNCLKRFGKENKWIGFVDADEHVRVKTGQTLPEFLKDYEDYAGIMAIWIVYGADGQVKKSNLPLRERFRKVSARIEGGLGKVFVQPSRMIDMYIHNGHVIDGYYVVGEYKDIVPDFSKLKQNPTTDLICVDHYFTKSYEEWVEKMKRGTANANYVRKYEEFFKCNPDMEHCRENIQIFQEYINNRL